jgi:cobalt-zinc-cadmium efflux system outer membrane protein
MIKIVIVLIYSLVIFPERSMASDCGDSFQSGAEFYRCALQRDPRISSLDSRKAEREGRETEARQIPNPKAESEFTFNAENRQAASILQPIEIGGKRSARLKIAEAENKSSIIEDQVALSEVAADLAISLVRFRQLSTRAALLEETKGSLDRLTARLRSKAVRTPEERNALTIFSMQSTVLDTQLLSIRQELKEVRSELEAAIGRKLADSEKLTSSEKKDWPTLDLSKMGETFESKLAAASIERAQGELHRQQSLGWPELAIGPAMERQAGSETSWGAKVEFVIPIFNTNGGARQRSRAELQRTEALAGRTKFKESANLKALAEQYGDVAKFLKNSPSQMAIRKSVTESLQLFSRAMIQPSAIVESYRSTLETLEAVQEKELTAYRLYWKLRSFSGEVPREFL